ncbi:MAG: hypothetical protein QGI00_03170 [Candidatus Marinimicrobia bacterium]|jgi:hypothetical protein|nr:hypothetical protein [Candidatus Neomarinimicrobiota bacterium]|tara:strand:+ start:10 stop:459 length:450 start_codon:yes stop_codon:yes gene_type:complete
MKFLNNYSNRELNIWAELILNILVSLFFVSKVFTSNQFGGEVLVQIISTTIILAIVYSIVVFGAINALTKREEKDERDYIYELKSYRISYYLSHGGILGIICLIVFNALYQENIGLLTPPKIAMILLIIALLSSTGKSLTQLFNYRKNI